jgi:hypothetical protein
MATSLGLKTLTPVSAPPVVQVPTSIVNVPKNQHVKLNILLTPIDVPKILLSTQKIKTWILSIEAELDIPLIPVVIDDNQNFWITGQFELVEAMLSLGHSEASCIISQGSFITARQAAAMTLTLGQMRTKKRRLLDEISLETLSS